MPQPVIGAIMFVVVTQSSRVAANRARSLRLGPICALSAGLLCPPTFLCRPVCLVAFARHPTHDTRTHAFTHTA